MKAAVLHAVGETPRFEEFASPVPGEGEELVSVLAAPLNAIDRALAAGSHYYRPDRLPAVVGVIGAGRLPDGRRVLFGSGSGTMAELAVVAPEGTFPIPDGLDEALAAAAWNPGLSAWLTLAERVRLEPGQSVLVLGATGVTGRVAVQAARRLGAARVVAAGRSERALEEVLELGADAAIRLDQPDEALGAAFAAEAGERGYDVVVDYLWGRPTEVLLGALTRHDLEPRSSRTRIVQAGDMAGSHVSVPATVLRSAGVEILGAGTGAMPPREVIVRTLGEVLALLATGELRVDFDRVALSRVEEVWGRDQRGRRPVFVP
jgi:NADPH:quinone reductase-like Zn-dependent oxidoreductase